MALCDAHPLTDFSDRCVRDFWSAIVPGAFAAFLVIVAVPLTAAVIRTLPGPLRKPADAVRTLFTNFLTLPEAEALDAGEDLSSLETTESPPVPLWRSLVLSGLALGETLAWLSVGSYVLVAEPLDVWGNVRPFIVAFAWFYAASRPVAKPSATPPYDIFVLFVVQFILAVITSGGLVYDNRVQDIPYPPTWILVSHVANLVVCVVLIIIILNMPLSIPSSKVNKDDIGLTVNPEDYTTLWGWLSFTWVEPLIKRVRSSLSLSSRDLTPSPRRARTLR